MPLKAVYEGTLTISSKEAYASSLAESYSLPATFKHRPMKVVFLKDASAEATTFSFEGKPHAILYLDAKAFILADAAFGKTDYREPKQAGGLPMLGFLLPPEIGSVHSRARREGDRLGGDPCGPEPGCQETRVVFHHFGVEYVARSTDGKLWRASLMGHEQARWQFEGSKDGFPQRITFRETVVQDFGTPGKSVPGAEAELRLVSITKDDKPLRREDVLPAQSKGWITREGKSTYRGTVVPSFDEQASLDRMQKIQQNVEAQRTFPYGTLIGVIVACLAVYLAVRVLRKP